MLRRFGSDQRAALAILGFIVLTLPFEVTKRVMPVEWLEVSRLGMVVAICWLAVALVRRPAALRELPRPLVGAVIAIFLIVAVSIAVTQWPNGPRELATIAAYAGFAAFVAITVRSRRDLAVVGICLLVSGLLVGLLSISEQLGDFYLWKDRPLEVLGRRNSTFADPNITGRFFLLCLVVAFGGLVARLPRSRTETIGILVSIVVVTGGLVYTLSRSGWLILVAVLALWAPLVIRRRPGAPGLALALVIASFALNLGSDPNALTRASDVPSGGENAPIAAGPLARRTETFVDPFVRVAPLDEVRRYLIRAGVAMFEDQPVAGVGVGGFQPELLGPYRGFIPKDRLSSPTSLQHTEVVRIAAETGLIGLAAYLALLAAAILELAAVARIGDFRDRVTAYVLGTGLGILVVSSQFVGRFYTEPYLWLILGLIAALGMLRRREAVTAGAA